MGLNALDLVVFGLFTLVVIAIALYASRREETEEDYFLAGRKLTWWLIGFSLIASNISTEHFVGMAGRGYELGLAIASYEWMAAITLVIVALFFLPRFLKAGIFTIPEFLEYRYSRATRTLMASYMLLAYVFVALASVLYSGSIAIEAIFGLDTVAGIWIVVALAGIYSIWGGLTAVVWSDLLQSIALLAGGVIVTILGFQAIGGWQPFAEAAGGRLSTVLPWNHPEMPWVAVFIGGLWIPNLFYWGLNQFITQRTLAAKTLADGQRGILLAACLKLLVPFIIVFPGIMAAQLFPEQVGRADAAYPVLMRELLPSGLRGFMFAALLGAVVSTLDSVLNSAATLGRCRRRRDTRALRHLLVKEPVAMTRPHAAVPATSRSAHSRASYLAVLSFVAAGCAPHATVSAQAAIAEPAWWRSGVCYEIFVRSFNDSDGDGIGDIRGLIDRLDYINDGDPGSDDDLGANCVWLMPIMPSPSYHGYDVTNYFEVNRDYGTLADFRAFVAAAHERGIHVLIDLVLNHISSEHPYFVDALIDTDSPYRDWFIWSPTTRPAPGWSAPVWHKVPGRDEYYYGLFWAGMPDYNLDNPDVKAEFDRIARFWLNDIGIDGFRIDAVGHFFEGPDGAWKHGPGTHPWLREFAARVEGIAPDAFTVGEVWDPIDEILPYYPDQLTAYFMFEIADAIFDAVRSGSGDRLVAAVQRVQAEVPDGRWGIFLRNHDQTRTLTDMNGDEARVRLAATLQLTLPGVPFVYYGEEIGMTGSKSDGDPRLRTPMHWSRSRAAGFTTGVPWAPLPADSFSANVAALDEDPGSLLNHYRRLIRLRTSSPALATGTFVPVTTTNDAALAWLRRTDDGHAALVIANLGEQPLADVGLTVPRDALERGNYSTHTRLGEAEEGSLQINAEGAHGWVPVADLPPLTVVLIELRKR